MEIEVVVVGGGNDDDVGDVLARYSLDVSAGCGGRRSTLLDEYERLAFEAQLNSAILRRCYSEPSPVRFVQPSAAGVSPAAPARRTEGEGRREEPAAAGRSWRLHEVVANWLQMLKTYGALLARERVGVAPPAEGAGHATRPARDGATSNIAGLPALGALSCF